VSSDENIKVASTFRLLEYLLAWSNGEMAKAMAMDDAASTWTPIPSVTLTVTMTLAVTLDCYARWSNIAMRLDIDMSISPPVCCARAANSSPSPLQ